MKNLLAITGAAALLAASACTGGSSSSVKPGLDSLFTALDADTMAQAVAVYEGWEKSDFFAVEMEKDKSLTKEAFMKGFRYGFEADTAKAFSYGLYTAFNISSTLMSWEADGVSIDRGKFLKAFEQAFMSDSVNAFKIMEARDDANLMTRRLNAAKAKYEIYLIETSDEAVGNVERGRQYIDSVAKADSDVKVKASGVAYKILAPGSGEKVADMDNVLMHYSGRTIDGREFDRADKANSRMIPVSTRIPGMREVLKELGKGGKAIIYIPGKEAYGASKARRYRLGPNEMVIFEVEVLDIANPEQMEATAQKLQNKKR